VVHVVTVLYRVKKQVNSEHADAILSLPGSV